MINKLLIDGFRSLINFEMTLNRGLNVIVGSNGTGKSNFVSFLDFLGTFLDNDLNSAIAIAQGAGSVFSQERTGVNESRLSFVVCGSWRGIEDEVPDWRRQELSKEADYKYTCEVRYNSELPAVFVAFEEIEITSGKLHAKKISRRTFNEGSGFRTSVLVEVPQQVRDNMLQYVPASSPDRSVESFIASRLAPEDALFSFASYMVDDVAAVLVDMTRYRSVNIDPAVARRATPVGSSYQLLPSGEGLAGSLYQLQKGAGYIPRGRLSRRFPAPYRRANVKFDDIVSWCQEVNPSICGISVRLSFSDAQLNPFMQFLAGDVKREYSFSRISDGTVKWLAIVTMLLSDTDLSIIEEPENFLHPFMQEIFITLCRSVLDPNPDRCLILSTHSPALIDCCDPKEIKLFNLDAGQTKADDVENWEELRQKIQQSRFGLGYYYKIGALHGADRSFR